MQFNHLSQSERVKQIALWALSIGLLFFGFFSNTWRVADQNWFATHQKDTEAHIMGRMVKSRQDGIFSAGGLNGWGTAKSTDAEWIPSTELGPQYTAYLYELSFEKFSTYNSQPGGQGMIFSLLDRLIPFSPQTKLRLFYVLTALLSAIALTALIGWFYEEFGGWVALFVIGSAVLSQWLTVFGKNLWWSLWAFYLPMIVVLYFLKRYRETLDRQLIRFGIVIFIAVSIKCFINGYEYITTTLVMMLVPFVYYAILDRWRGRQCVKWTLVAGLGSGVAIFLSFIMLCFQIGAAKDGFMDGVEHIIWSFGKRTYGEAEDFPPVYAASLNAGTLSVVITYMNGIFFDLNNYLSISNDFVSNFLLKIRYYYLIFLFIVMSALLFWRVNKVMPTERHRPFTALIWATWFSMLAPLSWFIIFKAHSYIHTHMSFLLWQMPFTLFGFAVFGSAVIAWTKKQTKNSMEGL
ncbi:hypothetical protein F4009_21315 [Candidatus Poribacteria bacterium]|nr:hypothetical protein [Candidatus Poribacteria bacterium]MYH79680.1 hypothetical protein [Candidatus Poribacteria bacterium]MYK96502.1 hypothetical protein [Candidatus Poribacteria bacterium]